MVDFAQFKRGGTLFPLNPSSTSSLLQDADPSVFYALAFYKQVLETHLEERLVAEAESCGAPIDAVVAQTCSFDPHPVLQQDQFQFPLLAIYRVSAQYPMHTTAIAHNIDQWQIAYILPPLSAGQMERILPILNAVSMVIDDRTLLGFDPSYDGTVQAWAQAGPLESIWLDSAEFGRLENLAGDLFFPAWIGHLTVKERKMRFSGDFTQYQGSDIDVKETPFDVNIKSDVPIPGPG